MLLTRLCRRHAQGHCSPPARHPRLRARRAAQCKKCGEKGQAGAGVDAPSDNSARYCGGVRRRGKDFGVGKSQGEREEGN